MVYKVKLHDKDTFLQHRLEQESKISETMDSTNPLTSILTIELSTTELCNRTCVFCPRYDPKVYPNRNLHMTVKTIEAVSNALKKINYKIIDLKIFYLNDICLYFNFM